MFSLDHTDFENQISYLVNIISEDTFETMQGSMLCDQNLIKDSGAELYLNNTALPYAEEDGVRTYYLSESSADNRWSGTITIQQTSDDISVACLEDAYSSEKQDAIEENHVYTLVIYDQDAYQEVNLIVTGTPVCSLDTVSSEMVEDDDDSGDMIEQDTGTFVLFDGTQKYNNAYTIVSDTASFHVRGASSKEFDKKSYSVKLLDEQGGKQKEDLLGMGESAKWVLDSLYNEPSKVREQAAYTLWNEIADSDQDMDESGAQMEYCEVILNHEYVGLYGLVYPINQDTLNLQDGDILYKVFSWNMDRDDFISHMEAGDTITSNVEIKYPDESDDWTSLWQSIFNYQEYGSWNVDVSKEMEGIKLDNQLDYYLFLQVTEANDSMFKNAYFVEKESDGGKMTMIPWDLNYTFGDIWMSDAPSMTYCDYPDVTDTYGYSLDMQNNLIYNSGDDTTWNRLCDLYAQYREDVLSDQNIEDLLENNNTYLITSGALDRDRAIWPESEDTEDITQMVDYVKERLAYLDSYFVK